MTSALDKIAERCGLSVDVVEKIVRAFDDAGVDACCRVLDAAKALNYPLKNAGSGIHRQNVGVLFTDESASGLTHPFFASVLNSFKATVEAQGYDVTFINHHIGKESATFLEHCRYRNLDGVFLACVDFYSQEVQALLESDIPCVTIDYPNPKHPCVISDNREGLKLLVDYAVTMGHRRIAFISGQCNSEVTQIRRQIYLDAMKSHNLPVPEGYLVEGRYSDTNLTRQLVTGLLQRVDRPSCILLPDDATYFGAQEAVHAHELRIPADISLAGYDGIPLTQSLRPQLTTIRQRSEVLGEQAALRLIQGIEQPRAEDGEIISVPVEMIKGSTIGWCNDW